MEDTLLATHRDSQIGGYPHSLTHTHLLSLALTVSLTDWRVYSVSLTEIRCSLTDGGHLTEIHRLEGTLSHTL